MHRQYVTREYLIEALTPLIGQKLDVAKRTQRHLTANIARPGQRRYDADIRAITDEGIRDYFLDRIETLRWEDIREVQFVLRDGMGNVEREGAVLALSHDAPAEVRAAA